MIGHQPLELVGWSMNAAMTAQLVTDALVMAIWRSGKPNALLRHSDRGSQYTSEPPIMEHPAPRRTSRLLRKSLPIALLSKGY